jgi:hypothetical protein
MKLPGAKKGKRPPKIATVQMRCDFCDLPIKIGQRYQKYRAIYHFNDWECGL